VWSIYEDRGGVLWVATPGGLGRLKDGVLTSYTSRDGLSDEIVLALFEDREGSLWIGTEAGGLNRLKDAKFTTYSAKDGLTNDCLGGLSVGGWNPLGRHKRRRLEPIARWQVRFLHHKRSSGE
jgi:ligand-binding sensor domain-containing protein